MIKLIVTLITIAFSLLQSTYVFGGMAPNPNAPGAPYVYGGIAPNPFVFEFCPPHVCPPPEITHNGHGRALTAPLPTETPVPTPEEPTPEPSATPEPTPEPWACPAIGDCTKQEYKQLCLDSCKLAGNKKCGAICNDCWEE